MHDKTKKTRLRSSCEIVEKIKKLEVKGEQRGYTVIPLNLH